ncbi:vestitone reductase-like [Solanum stenotomum]|uniref:vestitone reductase-like n=1 Tax=Solanum stenotomum TaxID=172797 RepID=UPI0020D05AF5|nr:vestitone reductase-like [Solanum stenotomum]
MEKINEKGIVCVTGGTGYVTSWLILRLLQSGYYVNTTINNNMDEERASFLKKLPNASQKLKIFTTNHEDHESYNPAIEGCNGVIIGHSVDFEDKYDDEEREIQRSIDGTLGILKACLDSKTIKRVIYTSSDGTIGFIEGGPNVVDESNWTNIEYDSGVIALVHVDDVARAHIFLLESTKVKGSCLKVTKAFNCPRPCSKKLLDVGFKYKYSLEDMYDGAIASCKQIGLL